MTMAIHYNGKLENRARLDEMLDAARLYCAEQRWMYRDVDEKIIGMVERTTPTADINTETVPINDTLTGILVTIHPRTEPLWLTFTNAGELAYYMPVDAGDTYWELKSLSTRTGAAGIETHLAVCELLHDLQANYFPGLHVYDESGYFESRDPERLSIESDLDEEPADAQDQADPTSDDAELGVADSGPVLKRKRKQKESGLSFR